MKNHLIALRASLVIQTVAAPLVLVGRGLGATGRGLQAAGRAVESAGTKTEVTGLEQAFLASAARVQAKERIKADRLAAHAAREAKRAQRAQFLAAKLAENVRQASIRANAAYQTVDAEVVGSSPFSPAGAPA